MKQLLLFPLLSISMLQVNNPVVKNLVAANDFSYEEKNDQALELKAQPDGSGKMSAAVFKAQDFCRAEVKDFEFETQFTIVSATVYFSGKNFTNPEKGAITSSSLKPIKSLMERCVPGSMVIFDEVKVMEPDNKLRTIQGISLVLN